MGNGPKLANEPVLAPQLETIGLKTEVARSLESREEQSIPEVPLHGVLRFLQVVLRVSETQAEVQSRDRIEAQDPDQAVHRPIGPPEGRFILRF